MDTTVEEMTPSELGKSLNDGRRWYTREEKEKLVADCEAFEATGGTEEDFAKQHDLSAWSMKRYKRQIRGKTRPGRRNIEDIDERIARAKQLIAGGMGVMKAAKHAGISYPQFNYQVNVKSRHLGQKHEPRQVKPMPAVKPDDFNKSLRARIIALERLVIEQCLDIQALKEAMEGRV